MQSTGCGKMTASAAGRATGRGGEPIGAPAGGDGVTVFYDGACPLCAAEIDFYRRRRGADRVAWVDVGDETADAAEEVAPGLKRDAARRRFHVRAADGRLVSGGQAFVTLWQALPGFARVGRLFRSRPLAWAIDRAYDAFLTWRPWLQRLARRRSRRDAGQVRHAR
jgi:predicted DCC family thiol-disulfide oxidoreductase YuxK